jgi:hypothetical protein
VEVIFVNEYNKTRRVDMIKTNNVVEWTVVDNKGAFVETAPTRKIARIVKNWYNTNTKNGNFRIAKVVVTK